jgi:preprotein translocase subunit SecA
MEDDLMRLFGGERMKNLMTTLRIPDNEPIEASMVSRSIEQAQKKIEGLNFDTRKHVLEFDDVLNHQRTTIYRRRRQYLLGADGVNSDEMKAEAVSLLKDAIDDIVTAQFQGTTNEAEAIEQVMTEVETVLPLSAEAKARVNEALQNAASRQFALVDLLTQEAELALTAKAAEFEGENYWHIVRYILLSTIDALWMEHLDTMDHLRDSVRLRGYGQRDPLVEYRKEGHQLFARLQTEINRQVAGTLLKVTPQVAEAAPAPQPLTVVTNQSDAPQVTSALVGDSSDSSVGRNDPCPCGSGKKYKKCGLLNTPEHQKLMAGK